MYILMYASHRMTLPVEYRNQKVAASISVRATTRGWMENSSIALHIAVAGLRGGGGFGVIFMV